MTDITWAGLVSAAVLGSGRAAVPVAGQLAGRGLDHEEDQTRLLHYAAAMSRARRAGFRAPEAAARPAPAPAERDHRPAVPLAAEQRLAGLLAAGQYDLAAEWLAHLAGRRPPDVLLPALLTVAAGRPGLRARLLPSLGPLAGWLAGFNEEWAWARTAVAERGDIDPAGLSRAWQTGGAEERRALLSRLRSADPATGRDLVASTWASDPYRDRAAFIAMLVDGLSDADEALAEVALADRRAEVRQAAADLLARLPGSRYSRRAAERAAAVVQVDQAGLRRRLRLFVPDPATDQPPGDGTGGPAPHGAGAQAWLLTRLVAAAPAGFWAGHTGLDPAGLLVLADRTDWSGPLRAGWTAAAIRDADFAWLLALLDAPPPGRLSAARAQEHGLRLFDALPRAAAEQWLLANPDNPLLWAALERLAGPWSARLSDQVRAWLVTLVGAEHRYSAGPQAALRLAAMRLEPPVPPAIHPALIASPLAASWDNLLNTLSVRAAIRRELAEEP
jgi:hypothetical protein